MGSQLAKEQEQLKNLNCKIRLPTFDLLLTTLFSQWERTVETL
jgi:hypothetical protein